jgi:hypothetical protein
VRHGRLIDELRFHLSGRSVMIPDSVETDVKYDEIGGAYLVLALGKGRRTVFVVMPEKDAVAILDDAADLLSRKGGRLHNGQSE